MARFQVADTPQILALLGRNEARLGEGCRSHHWRTIKYLYQGYVDPSVLLYVLDHVQVQ